MASGRPINVLIVDDSSIVRTILREALEGRPGIGSVRTAPDAHVAYQKIVAEPPDVVTLDLEMPRMDGLTFLKKLMQWRPLPVVVISSIAQRNSVPSLEALRLGAVEVLPKPGGPYSVGQMKDELAARLQVAAGARPFAQDTAPAPRPAARKNPASPFAAANSTVVAIGASTGGVRAIEDVLQGLPEDCPGIVMTQHIPPEFSSSFARRLDQVCPMRVKEAADGDTVEQGLALLAPGGHHVLLRRSGAARFTVRLWDGPPVCFQRPSVDVMFASVAEAAGKQAIGVLLTGMGADGAEGLLAIRSAGGRTMVQDQDSCVIFGMPKEAIAKGAAERVLPLSRIAAAIESCARQPAVAGHTR